LAKEIGADFLVIDERKARRIAQVNDQKVIGTIGILQKAKDAAIITEIKPLLDKLIEQNIWIDDKLYNAILAKNDEM